MATQSQYGRGYNSFSGVDIKGVFGNKVIAELQAISWSITREKAPIYTMGAADPRSFSRGKRGIAGTLIFIVFDRHVLLGTLGMFAAQDPGLYFLSDKDDVKPADAGQSDLASVDLASALQGNAGNTVQFQESELLTSIEDDQEGSLAWYADQIPPIDITLAAANEYGSLAVMRIFGLEIMNEGCGVSIDDIVTEQQHTYIARTIIGWRPVRYLDPATKRPTP